MKFEQPMFALTLFPWARTIFFYHHDSTSHDKAREY